MEKKTFFLFITFLISLFIFNSTTIFAQPQEVGLSLTIDNSPPDATLIYPEDGKTYNYDTNICLHFLVIEPYSQISNIWYKLDSSPDIELTTNTTINLVDGTYNIQLFANDTLSFLNNSEQSTFTIDTTLPETIEVPTIYDGLATTDFDSLTKLGQQAIKDMTLESTSHGKIIFDGFTDIIDDGRDANCQPRKVIDLFNTDISSNRIFIDTIELPQLNKSAILSLYGLTINDPKILKDGQDCPPNICTIINYFNGVLEFTVTELAEYRAAESFIISGSPGTGGGDGGGSGGGNRPYIGIIQEPTPLFDVKVDIDEEYKVIVSGDKIIASIFLENIGLKGTPVDVELNMFIMDFDKEISYAFFKETVAVDITLTLSREFPLPENAIPGKYLLIIEATYNNITVDSFDLFEISSKELIPQQPKKLPNTRNIIGIVILLLLIIYFAVYYSRSKRKKR